MGADASMYGEAFRDLNAIRYVNWPEYDNEQSIPEMAERSIRKYGIQPDDIVGGSSLGGIVAAEIARHVHLRYLILIGSTLTPDNINPVLRKLSVLSEITPVALLQVLAGKANAVTENRMLTMFRHSDVLFIKSMCKAVCTWEGNQKPNCPVAHIHGEKDTVIFPPATGAEIIPGGGHLIAMTHESDVVNFIKNISGESGNNKEQGIFK